MRKKHDQVLPEPNPPAHVYVISPVPKWIPQVFLHTFGNFRLVIWVVHLLDHLFSRMCVLPSRRYVLPHSYFPRSRRRAPLITNNPNYVIIGPMFFAVLASERLKRFQETETQFGTMAAGGDLANDAQATAEQATGCAACLVSLSLWTLTNCTMPITQFWNW